MPLSLAPGLTLYFSRHGETEANVAGRLQGQSRDTPLTAKGREQARGMATTLSRNEAQAREFAFVSSPLGRARATIEIIRDGLGLPPSGYSIDPRIIEMSLGSWEGLTKDEARSRDPETYDRRALDKWSIRIPGGEDYSEVAERARSWIESLRADTIAVSHGGFTRILRGLIEDLSWEEMSALEEPQDVAFRLRGHSIDRLSAA